MLVGSALAAVLLVATLGVLISLVDLDSSDQKRDTQAMLGRVNAHLAAIQNEQAKLDASCASPATKSFSTAASSSIR